MLERILEWIFPRKCVLCRGILGKEETDLCRGCRTDSPEYRYGERTIRHAADVTAVWYYEDHVRSSLLRYKFRNARSYAEPYGRMLAMRIARDFPDFDCVTWVPVSPRRLRKRGYDQVELLAQSVSRELNIPCVRLLEKIRDNRANSTLKTPAERSANVLGAYREMEVAPWKEKRVLLLDDIITTGATAVECTRVLRTAGIQKIYVAAVAAVRNTNK